jgi:hypothetical protein
VLDGIEGPFMLVLVVFLALATVAVWRGPDMIRLLGVG